MTVYVVTYHYNTKKDCSGAMCVGTFADENEAYSKMLNEYADKYEEIIRNGNSGYINLESTYIDNLEAKIKLDLNSEEIYILNWCISEHTVRQNAI